jgi:hypothetical protein
MVRLTKIFLKNRPLALALIVFGLFITSILAVVNFYFRGKIFPEIKIAGINVSRLTKEEAISLVSKRLEEPKAVSVHLKDTTFGLDFEEIDFSYDVAEPLIEHMVYTDPIIW